MALYTRHIAVHSGTKQYMCTCCEYATSHKSNLLRHGRVHMYSSVSTQHPSCRLNHTEFKYQTNMVPSCRALSSCQTSSSEQELESDSSPGFEPGDARISVPTRNQITTYDMDISTVDSHRCNTTQLLNPSYPKRHRLEEKGRQPDQDEKSQQKQDSHLDITNFKVKSEKHDWNDELNMKRWRFNTDPCQNMKRWRFNTDPCQNNYRSVVDASSTTRSTTDIESCVSQTSNKTDIDNCFTDVLSVDTALTELNTVCDDHVNCIDSSTVRNETINDDEEDEFIDVLY